MIDISTGDIDGSIDRVVALLAEGSGSKIRELYPNQRELLHELCKGIDIFYTGTTQLHFLLFWIVCWHIGVEGLISCSFLKEKCLTSLIFKLT